MSNNVQKMCVNTGMHFDMPLVEQLKTIKSAGFDCVFTDWEKNIPMQSLAEEAARVGLTYQSLHAPFYGMDDIWHDEKGELAKKMADDICATIDDCKRYDIPIVIMHTIIGMDNHSPNELGLERIEKLVEYAGKNGIKVAFENTEGEEYLEAVFAKFGGYENVGFCFDSGHEMCYNYSHDMLGKYGKYLVSTHLNDNFKMADVNNMTFLDDYHLLPFDGKADWENIAHRLDKFGFEDTLTFELISTSKPGRHANDIYLDLSFEEYVCQAYEHADRFRKLYNSIRSK